MFCPFYILFDWTFYCIFLKKYFPPTELFWVLNLPLVFNWCFLQPNQIDIINTNTNVNDVCIMYTIVRFILYKYACYTFFLLL